MRRFFLSAAIVGALVGIAFAVIRWAMVPSDHPRERALLDCYEGRICCDKYEICTCELADEPCPPVFYCCPPKLPLP